MFLIKNRFKVSNAIRTTQLLLLLFISGWSILCRATQPPTIHEYQLKAVYLYNFTYFIRWPKTTFKNSFAPFRICILGEDPFRTLIDLAVENETINQRIVKIRRLHYIEESNPCQILFVSQSEHRYRSHIFAFLQNRPILTISDMKNFIKSGGMIQFYNYKDKVRFCIANQMLKKVGIKASSRLLQLANKNKNQCK